MGDAKLLTADTLHTRDPPRDLQRSKEDRAVHVEVLEGRVGKRTQRGRLHRSAPRSVSQDARNISSHRAPRETGPVAAAQADIHPPAERFVAADLIADAPAEHVEAVRYGFIELIRNRIAVISEVTPTPAWKYH